MLVHVVSEDVDNSSDEQQRRDLPVVNVIKLFFLHCSYSEYWRLFVHSIHFQPSLMFWGWFGAYPFILALWGVAQGKPRDFLMNKRLAWKSLQGSKGQFSWMSRSDLSCTTKSPHITSRITIFFCHNSCVLLKFDLEFRENGAVI